MYEINDQEYQAIEEVLKSQKYFRYQGRDVSTISSKVERKIETIFNSPHALLCSSGTNALILALKTAGIGHSDEVIIPSFTFIATASAVLNVGAVPVVANIDDTLTICPKDVSSKITDKTKAIIPVHMDGLVCQMDELEKICQEHSLLMIEDVAQAIGGEYKGKKLGTIGDFGCFSFNVDKIITCGEGGLVLCKNEDSYKKMFALHDQASAYGPTMAEELVDYKSQLGHSMRISEIQSVFLDKQLDRLESILFRLRNKKKEFIRTLESSNISLSPLVDAAGDCGTSIHIICSDPLDCMAKAKQLLALGFKASPTYLRPAHACWQWFDLLNQNTPAEYNYEKSQFLQSVQILTSSLKISIDLDATSAQINQCVEILSKK